MTRIALVGGFDVENFGDLLFPPLATHALAQRVENLEVTAYAGTGREPPAWPFEVRPLAALIEEIPRFDLLVVGGGELVHFYPDLVGPDDPRLHDPTSLWMGSTLLAGAHGIPVAWNAVGVGWNTVDPRGLPDWARAPTAAAIRTASYVAVRDEPSAVLLREVTPNQPIEVVPDTAFGVAELVPAEPSQEYRRLVGELGLERPYVVVQPSPHLAPYWPRVAARIRRLHEQGYAVLELPIGPFHGDRNRLLGLDPPTTRVERWPDPLLIAELISRAHAAIGISLHLGITATVFGVPVTRPRIINPTKHAILDSLPGVELWDDSSGDDSEPPPARDPSAPAVVADMQRQLGRHWDRIADCIGRANPGGPAAVGELLLGIPDVLEHLDSVTTASREESSAWRVRSKSWQARSVFLQGVIDQIVASHSWRLTAPLRRAKRLVRRRKRGRPCDQVDRE